MTQVVPNAGSRTSQDLYIGASAEVTVDLSNKELRVHDGATPGGERIPNIDTNDSRYQGQNEELNGFKFDPNLKGFLARVAAGVYRLRTLVSDGNILIKNPLGTAGNPEYSLATSLKGDREIDGDFRVTGVAEIQGGLNADTAGTHSGPSIGSTEGAHKGDLDTRGHVVHFDSEQIPQASITGLLQALAALSTPVGMVSMWSGTIETIPTHWHLCDGTAGTPDLRARFVVGITTNDDVNRVGGSANHTHVVTTKEAGVHAHPVTVDAFQLLIQHMPKHQHGSGVCDNYGDHLMFNHGYIAANPVAPSGLANDNRAIGDQESLTNLIGGDSPHSHTATSGESGSHVHVAIAEPSSSLPPFYALAYIMRIN